MSFLNQVSLIRNYCLVCVVIVLYRFQGSYRSRKRLCGGSRNQLCYLITISALRQPFFLLFLGFFQDFLERRTNIPDLAVHCSSLLGEPFPSIIYLLSVKRVGASAAFLRHGCPIRSLSPRNVAAAVVLLHNQLIFNLVLQLRNVRNDANLPLLARHFLQYIDCLVARVVAQ